jgi:methyl-accepting chemotaxis protein WspA
VEAVNGIVAAMAELAGTLLRVSEVFTRAAESAASGRSDLGRMGEAMRRMEAASSGLAERLETINERAASITEVVTTITRLADQTNLLSLNAGIEANKAGEAGRGFTVVAREIRRLADQTAVATVDIDQIVHQMQEAVGAGVGEMTTFVDEVRSSADDVEGIGREMSGIIEQFETLSPMLEQVRAEMDRQAESASGVGGVMTDLSREMAAAVQSLRRSYAAIEVLQRAADALATEVDRFRVDLEGE